MFTDVSPAFTERAAERFQAYPFVRYQLLDIERDPEAQGIALQQFDLILAVNVLHATRSLRDTLRNLQRLLVPGGILAIVEATRPLRWLDITFGMTEGWWRFADEDLRPSHPLLPRQKWLELLSASGFTEPIALPEVKEDGDTFSAQALLLARAPREDGPRELAPRTSRLAGDWLILADRGGVGARVAERIHAEGGRCVIALSKPGGPASQGDELAHLWRESRGADAAPWRGVLHLWSLDADSGGTITTEGLEAANLLGCGTLLHLVQAALRGPASPIWVATRRAQAIGGDAMRLSVAQAPVWGMGRVVALEHPELWGGLVDLDDADPDTAAARLLEQIGSSDREDQVAWRGDSRHVARLVRSRSMKLQPMRWPGDGACLITGGLGRLGLKVADWMAEQGVRHLVLVGRKGLPDRGAWADLPEGSDAARRAAAVRAIEARGTTVQVVAADVGDRKQMAALLAQFGRSGPRLRGVIHAAVAARSEPLRDMTIDALQSVFRPKVSGAWVLHELTAQMELDFFVLFSSTTALLGVKDLAHYAAANTFLDALAHHRKAAGRPAVSINWGIWDEVQSGSVEQQRATTGAGLRPMPAARALKALGLLAASDSPQAVVADVNWATLKAVYETKRRRPFLEQLGSAPSPKRPAAAPAQDDLRRRLDAARPQDRWDVLVEHVRAQVAGVLRLEPGRTIELHRGLFDLGLDSLMSVELKSRLEASVGHTLPSTLTFNYPNVGALTDYLAREVLSLQSSPSAASIAGAGEPATTSAESGELSEDELAARLAERLAQIR